jgi:ribosomal peptide maturation radical SAM protein 1
MLETAATTVETNLDDTGRAGSVQGERRVTAHSEQPADGTEPWIRAFRVAVVAMPFARCYQPVMPVGMLKAVVRRFGFPVDDYYPNLDLAAQLGFDVYDQVMGDGCTGLLGEWASSVAAFGQESNHADYFAAFPGDADRLTLVGLTPEFVNDLRERIMPEFMDACLDRIDWGSYAAVVFTSTYQQNVASLALARRIKQRHPHVAIIFCGGNVEGEMGIECMRAFPYIDYAVGGELEETIPELLRRIAAERDPYDLLGVAARRGESISFAGHATPVGDLDALPIPDFDTFYEAARRYGLDETTGSMDAGLRTIVCGIPIEASRGCWWGEKSHCTFCGLVETRAAYRSKSPERILAEIEELSARYGKSDFSGTDLVLDRKYVKQVFEPLSAGGHGYRFYFCVRANLKRDEIRTLAGGGMRVVVAGIESLNTHVLKLMRKGVSRLQNVNLLRWCTYYGIAVFWNLLYGLAGEQLEDYTEELETLRLIPFVIPPIMCQPLRLDRFSPDFRDTQLCPRNWQRPMLCYSFAYPSYVNLEEVAYFFDYGAASVVPEDAHEQTQQFVCQWRRDWYTGRRASLTYRRVETDLLLQDTRWQSDQPRSYTLPDVDADIYEAFSSGPRTVAQVCAALASERPDLKPDEETIAATCDDLCDAGLMIGEGGKYLSLALPADPEI